MWNKILQDLRKSKEKNDKQRSLAEQIAALNERMGKETGSKCFIFCLFRLLSCIHVPCGNRSLCGIAFALAFVVQESVFDWGCLGGFMC